MTIYLTPDNWQQQVACWRTEVNAWHPTPEPFACVAYLVTEAAEALDRALREQRPHDDRTNHHSKKATLGRELAQVIDMACTSASAYNIDLEAELQEWFAVVRARGATPLADADVNYAEYHQTYSITPTYAMLREDPHA